MARTKGSKNKKTFEVEEIAARFDLNPFEVLMMVAAGDWKGLGFDSKTQTVYTAQGIEMEVENIRLSDRVAAAKEAARYLFSTKQPVDPKTGDSAIRMIIEDYSKK